MKNFLTSAFLYTVIGIVAIFFGAIIWDAIAGTHHAQDLRHLF